MMADFIIAADSAKFGQPEIKLGVTPGMGGSQRLTHAVGKAKAMEMCLTGRMMGAEEAERSGLVARVVPAAELIDEAMKTAETIAAMSPIAAMANKEMVNAAFENGLAQGIDFERRLFHGLFGTEDQKEGMAAFVEKRAAEWKGSNRIPAKAGPRTGQSQAPASPGTKGSKWQESPSSASATWAAAWPRTSPRRATTSAPSISPKTPCSAPRRAAAPAPPPPPRRSQEADAVVTMLPAGKHVRDVYETARDRHRARPAPS